MKLQPFETKLQGTIIEKDGSPNFDGVAQRIAWLTENYLTYLTSDETGWFSLYRDPSDNRLWEKTFADSQLQGGGVPVLSVVTDAQAAEKYRI